MFSPLRQMFIGARGEVLLLPPRRYEQDGGGIETTTERRVAFTRKSRDFLGRRRRVRVADSPGRRRLRRGQNARTGSDRIPGPAIRAGCRFVPFYAGCERLEDGDAIQWGGTRLCDDGRFPPAMDAPFQDHLRCRGPGLENASPTSEFRHRGTFVVSTRRGKQFNLR